MSKNRKRLPPMLDAIAKLVNGDRLCIAYTECAPLNRLPVYGLMRQDNPQAACMVALVQWLYSGFCHLAKRCNHCWVQVRPCDGVRGGPGPRAGLSEEHQSPPAQPGRRPDSSVGLSADKSNALLHLGRQRVLSREATQKSQACFSGAARHATAVFSSLGRQPQHLGQKRIAGCCDGLVALGHVASGGTEAVLFAATTSASAA